MSPSFSPKPALEQKQFCIPSTELEDFICCGVKIDFYEDCGHTMTIADHHRFCIHFDKRDNIPDERYGRLLTGYSIISPPLPMSPIPSSKLPSPQPRCRDLHRYITFIPATCGCEYPEHKNPFRASDLATIRSERTSISAAEILKRRIYWLQQQSLDDEKHASVAVQEWHAKIRKHQQQEGAIGVPFANSTFVYDPDTVGLAFLRPVEKAHLAKEQSACVICKKPASNSISRMLPCGCVFDLKCLKRWFWGRKDCPLCRKKFKLVKKPRPYEGVYGEPAWEDDDYSGFI